MTPAVATDSDASTAEPAIIRRTLWTRRAGLAIGAALLVAAAVMLLLQRDVVHQAAQAIAGQPRSHLLIFLTILCGTMAANLLLSGAMFHLLTSRYGKVGWWEMQALIASTMLANYLPMRPGLFGRVAYHKAVNQIAVGDSVRVILQATGMSVLTAGYLSVTVLLALSLSLNPWWVAPLPLPALVLGSIVSSRLRSLLLAAALRYAEVLLSALRYYAAFALIGAPINAAGALAFACIGVIATMVPLVSNGLGLREWGVGLVAPLLTSYHMALGITADLLMRAAELLVVAAAGLIGFAYLAALRRRAQR